MTIVKTRLAAIAAMVYERVASADGGEMALVLMWSLTGMLVSAAAFLPGGLSLG